MNFAAAEAGLIKIIPTDIAHGNVAIGKHQIHYVKAGSGPDLVLVHGINMGWGQWYPNIAALAEHATVYAIDLPGAGQSSLLAPEDSRFSMEVVAVIEEFIKKMGLKNPDLMGHSIGGWAILMVALRKKVAMRKLILASPLGFSTKTPAKYRPIGFRPAALILSKTAMKPSPKNMKDFATSVLYNKEILRKEFVDYYAAALEEYGHSHPFLWINRFSGVFHIRKEFVLLDQLSAIQQPTLIAVGKNDTIIPPSKENMKAFRLMPNSVVMVFAESGHVIPTEESVIFNNAAIQFLTT